MTRSQPTVIAALLLSAVGCAPTSLTFRFVDQTSGSPLPDVRARLCDADDPNAWRMEQLARSGSAGQITLDRMDKGDVISFERAGFGPLLFRVAGGCVERVQAIDIWETLATTLLLQRDEKYRVIDRVRCGTGDTVTLVMSRVPDR